MSLKKNWKHIATPLLASLTMCWCLTTLFGCGGDSNSEVSSKTSKFQVEGGDADDAKDNSSSSSSSDTTKQGNSPTTSSDDDGKRPEKPPVLSSAKINENTPKRSFEVPDGPPEKILSFVQELNSVRPASAEEAEKVRAATLAGFEKIIASDGDQDIRRTAVLGKIEMLSMMVERGTSDAEAKLAEFAKSIATDKNAEIARIGKIQSFGLQLQSYLSEESKDFEAIKSSLASLVEDKETLPYLVDLGRRAIGQLYRSDKVMDAVSLMKILGTAMTGHEQLGPLAESMLEESALIELVEKTRSGEDGADDALANHFAEMLKDEELKRDDFTMALGMAQSASSRGSVAAGRKVFALLVAKFNLHQKELIGTESPDINAFQIINTLATSCERSGVYDEAGKLYDLIEATFAKHSDEAMKNDAKQIAEAGRRRVGLVGKPFELAGLTLDGKPFDWTKYKGKTVLIDFWATWCGPCIAEIPNIEENYEAFREKGFEVVGVNIDADRADVDQFLADREMMWPSVFSDNPENTSAIADRCGVETIPFLVLVNKQGIVEELHVRGERLGEKLVQLLGPAPEKTGALENDDAQSDAISATTIDSAAIAPSASRESPLGGYFVALDAEEDEKVDDDSKVDKKDVNPYLARQGLSVEDLIDFILDMDEKPKSIQRRPGFTEAIAEAADRVLAADAKSAYQRIATISKFAALHKKASFGDEKCDKQLDEFVNQVKDSTDKRVAKEVRFLQLERRAINSDDLSLDDVQALLKELKIFFEEEKLSEKHLRMASSTVHAINRLDSKDPEEKEKYGDMREGLFKEFGEVFAKSDNKELATYGKKLAKTPKSSNSDLVGKPLELAGVTAGGIAFNWEAYRGKVVIVDFWATWCGPCRREMPHVKAFYEKHKGDNFDVVGVSLDKDLDALGQYIEENKIAWENLAGEDTQPLAQQYGVRGIPTMMLVDREGKIVAVAHKLGDLTAKAEELLKKPAA